jgi:hypothetical protein
MQDKQQIYGRNDMVMLYKHNKIYGSLGLTEQFVFDTINGENTVVLNNPKVGKFKDVVTDLNILGNSHQDSTTGKQLFDVSALKNISGFSVDEDGFIMQKVYNTTSPKTLKELIPSIEAGKSYYLSVDNPNDFTGFFGFTGSVSAWHKNQTFVPKEDDLNIRPGIVSKVGGNARYRLMITEGQTASPYEPYTGGKPSPSPDYLQQIKNVGKWNDEKQKYEVDVKVTNAEQNWSKEQVLTLTSDRPLTKWDRLVEQGGEIGWLYAGVVIDRFDGQSNKISIANKQGNVQNFSIRFENVANGNGNSDIFVDKYRAVQLSYTKAEYGICCNWNDGVKYFSAPNENVATVDEFKAWLIENPLKIAYETTNPEFVPLPQSEQDAVRNLKTYYPTTVITVDGGELPVGIQATYKQVNK